LNASATTALSVLSFWRDLEVFNIPTAPSAKDGTDQVKIVTPKRGNLLPWQSAEFRPTETHGYIHVVYVGVADTEDLSRLMLQAVFPDQDLSERERQQRAPGNGWLAAFVANEHGVPKLDSYLPASFAHGVDALWHSQSLDNINARLVRARDEFGQRRHRMSQVSAAPDHNPDPHPDIKAIANGAANTDQPRPGPLTWPDLDEEVATVLKLLGSGADAPDMAWRVVVRVTRVKRRYLDANLDAATDYLNSFYLDDLDRLITQARKNKPFGKALGSYLGAPLDDSQRIDILDQHTAMGELVSVARLPSARWPASAKAPLALAQQAAVAQVLHALGRDGGTLGVNGPPGTGKTTLLCDVIAEVVTERARKIAALSRPVDLFDDSVKVAGKNFFPLKTKVVGGSSIVVTSTNNNAVKNITQELPARQKVAEEFGPVAYFDEVIREVFAAQKVVDDDKQPIDCWGLVAAALGNAGNRRSFAKGFFRADYSGPSRAATSVSDSAQADGADPDAAGDSAPGLPVKALPPSMKQLLEAADKDYARYQAEWHAAKKVFLGLLDDFEARRAVLLLAEKAALRIDDCRDRLDAQRAAVHSLSGRIDLASKDLVNRRDKLSILRALVESRQATVVQLRSHGLPNLWDKLCALFGRESARMATQRQTLAEPTSALAQAAEALAELAREAAVAEALLDKQQAQHHTLVLEQQAVARELASHQRALQAGYDTGARHFPDARLWALPPGERHRASVAVGPALDTLRARIFLQAMELHRLTVMANAGKFIGNLKAVDGMLTGSLKEQLSLEQRTLLWDAFFFIVPVVSTTLASFDRLFMGMGQDSLGWLLIDEAGQATPQSAAGAIWRSQRAVLVGDPLQIEPVFTVPLGLVEELRQRHGVPALWSPKDESVQTLADRVTRHGSWVAASVGARAAENSSAQRLWTGMPLRTHRRCDDPMFTVANRIAYAGQMVHGQVDEQGHPKKGAFSCVLGESAWLDVQATRSQHPVVQDELDVLEDCLRTLQRQPAFTPAGKPGGTAKAAKIFVISPFRKVKGACDSRIKAAGIQGVDCGTVHTFQGKEAEIVLLVLGTAPGQAGSGARAWASGMPNLLNVAITRAKCRLYVIGNAAQWGGLNHFAELHQALPIRQPLQNETGLAQAAVSP